MFKRPLWALVMTLAASPALAIAVPTPIGFALLQASLADDLVAAVQAGQADVIAAALSPAEGQAAIEAIVQGTIATSGASPDVAIQAIQETRSRLACPPLGDLDAPAPATCPRWVNAALTVVEQQIRDALITGAPSATGRGSGAVSLPAPPSASGGGSGYRPAT